MGLPDQSPSNIVRGQLANDDYRISFDDERRSWYVLPLIGGSVLLVVGWHGRAGWLFSIGYTMFAAVLSWGIIALNQRAVRHRLQPKREDVVRLLAQVES
jgi:hypothetical protein